MAAQYDPIAPHSPTYQSHFRSESIQSESDPMMNNPAQGGSSRQQGMPVGRNEEVGGVQRGMVGAGYGPYAYTLPAGQPGPGRFPSKESSSSFDSSAYLPTKGRHNLSSAEQAQATPKQDSATTAFLLWDNKDDMDDNLHMAGGKADDHWDPFSLRGWLNAVTIFVLLAALIVLFAGWPIIVAFQNHANTNGGNTPGFNLGGINGSGQVPAITNFPSLIDQDTPANVRSRTGFDGKSYDLVFSDEFNTDGRTFYPGDDPFWEAVDLHYWPTGDFEWYDPGQITTKDGSLVIEMLEMETHGLNFRSGMLQSWNKFCFSQNAYIEVSVRLPGNNRVGGFWPGVWTMGNLGRPGYGATTDGTWPYSYDACDVGTLANQTYANGTGPTAALTTGSNDGPLSFLPGQRWSACTCTGEDHPGPATNKGRGAPEIDIIEAQIDVAKAIGEVSQSLQTAPFDASYQFAEEYSELYNTATVQYNSYLGGVYQQAISALANTNSANYAGTSGGYGVYGYEFTANPNDRDNAYITWVNTGQPSWTVRAGATGPNPAVGLSQRPIPEEPMAMIINFGMSNNFQTVDFEGLTFPNYMYVDYVRVYQRSDMINIGCDPSDYPTKDFIDRHPTAYNNRNLTTWDLYLATEEGSKFNWPKNRLIDTC